MPPDEKIPTDVAFSPDGSKILFGSWSTRDAAHIRVLNLAAPNTESRIEDAAWAQIERITFSVDGKRLLVAAQSKESRQPLLSIRDFETEHEVARLGGNRFIAARGKKQSAGESVIGRGNQKFSFDASRVMTVERKAITVTDCETGRVYRTVDATPRQKDSRGSPEFEDAIFLPDRNLILILEVSGTMRLWNLEQEKDDFSQPAVRPRGRLIGISTDGSRVLVPNAVLELPKP